MWLLDTGLMLLALIGIVMHLCGKKDVDIAVILAVLFAVGFHLFIAACLYLIALIFAVNGYQWVLIVPFAYLAAAVLIHLRYLRN